MRRVFVIFIMISLLFRVFAEELDKTDFTIHAYKIDRTGGIEFVVTDALASFDSLNRITNDERLILDDYITNYLGDPDEAPSVFSEMIIFSYRAAGTGSGTYNVNITLMPFNNAAADEVLTAGYTLGNVNYIFESSSTNKNDRGGTIRNEQRDDNAVVPDTAGANGVLYDQWSVNDTSGDPWIVRGAVALVLDSEEYSKISYGSYEAKVTVKLQTV